jgi:hypothetical protein
MAFNSSFFALGMSLLSTTSITLRCSSISSSI